ncbi:MAG: type IV pili methyl-accepting chemotaxis transducer N-terminal domain-containing protein [Pseudomonadota bacterium]
MKNRVFTPVSLGLTAFFLALSSPALSESGASDKAAYAERIGASERVNFSGKLRMLSQRVVATSCNYVAGIDPAKSGPAMEAAMSEFALIVDALEFGNADLGINGAEKRKKTIRRIGMLRDEWATVATELDAIAAGEKTTAHVTAIADQSAPLLDMAKLLVSDLSAQYSDPNAMLQSFAMLVDISGRQRMLSQRMSKNACLAASGINVEASQAELAATAEVFETSLRALRNGMAAAGIAPPPNATIAEGLKVVQTNWSELKPSVEAVLNGTELSTEERAHLFNGMNKMTGNMNKVVGQYSDASKFEGS